MRRQEFDKLIDLQIIDVILFHASILTSIHYLGPIFILSVQTQAKIECLQVLFLIIGHLDHNFKMNSF